MNHTVASLIETISKLTDINHHTAAVRALAVFVLDADAMDTCDAIESTHQRKGYISSEDYETRGTLRTYLLRELAYHYGEDAATAVRVAF